MSEDKVHIAHFKVTAQSISNLIRMFLYEGDVNRALSVMECCGVLEYSREFFMTKIDVYTVRDKNGIYQEKSIDEIQKLVRENFDDIENEIKELENMMHFSNLLCQELSGTLGGDWEEMIWHDGEMWRHGAKYGQFKIEECERPLSIVSSEIYYKASIDDNISLNKKVLFESTDPNDAIKSIVEHYLGVANTLKQHFPIHWGNL